MFNFFKRKNKNKNCNSVNFYAQFINTGDLCFDIGANIGDRTEIFLQLGAKVISVEPQLGCLKSLYKRFGSDKNVSIVEKAVGEENGFAEIAICKDAPTISTLSTKWKNEGRFSKDYQWTETQQVSMTTLDALIEMYGSPKFCKIDVEGFEYFVIKGLSKVIPFISFEFTKEFFDDAEKCMDHALTIGQATFNCSIGEAQELVFSQWLSKDSLVEKLRALDDELLWGDIYIRYLEK